MSQEERKPIRTKIIQKFTDGSKLIKMIPEPEQEAPEAPEMYMETIENIYAEAPPMDKYLWVGVGAVCIVVAAAVAAYVLYKEDEAPAPALAPADQL